MQTANQHTDAYHKASLQKSALHKAKPVARGGGALYATQRLSYGSNVLARRRGYDGSLHTYIA
jgi:hypothetical protein